MFHSNHKRFCHVKTSHVFLKGLITKKLDPMSLRSWLKKKEHFQFLLYNFYTWFYKNGEAVFFLEKWSADIYMHACMNTLNFFPNIHAYISLKTRLILKGFLVLYFVRS